MFEKIITSLSIALALTVGTSIYFYKEVSKIDNLFPVCYTEWKKSEAAWEIFDMIESIWMKPESEMYMKDMLVKSTCFDIIEQYMNWEIDL